MILTNRTNHAASHHKCAAVQPAAGTAQKSNSTGDAQADAEDIVTHSGKMTMLDRLLKKLLAKGHRAVLFSQFTSMLDLIEEYCKAYPDEKNDLLKRARPIEMRYVNPVNEIDPEPLPPEQSVWIRTVDTMPDDLRLNQCLLAYASDMTLTPRLKSPAPAQLMRSPPRCKDLVYLLVAYLTYLT